MYVSECEGGTWRTCGLHPVTYSEPGVHMLTGTGKNNLTKQSFQATEPKPPSKHIFLLFVLSAAHKLADVSHGYTNTYTRDSLITFRAGSDPQRSPRSVSHCEVDSPCQTAACTSLSLQPSWYQHTEATGQQLPDADAVGVPYRSDSLEPCRFPMTFV